MTVASQVNKVTYLGNGTVRTWPFSFKVLLPEHLKIYVTDADGNETQLTSGYAVDMETCSVEYPTDIELPPLASGEKITLLRELPLTQETDLENQGEMNAEELESAYDKLTMICQQLDEKTRRAILGPVSGDNPPEDIVTKLLAASESAQKAAAEAESVREWVVDVAYNGFEIGTPKIYRTGTQPDGYLLMDGSSFSSSVYPELAQSLGSSYVPDWRESHALPSGWNWYIKGLHKGNVVGSFKKLSVKVVTVETGTIAYAVYDDSTTTLTLYIPKGERGEQGPQGAVGPTGPAGPQGIQGVQGIQGPQGEQGLRGPEGAQGQKGDTGAQGPRGEQGPQGIQGERGEKGEKGDQGEQGIPGPEGLKGPQGDKGPDGTPPQGLSWGEFSVDSNGDLGLTMYGLTASDNVTAEIDESGDAYLILTTNE